MRPQILFFVTLTLLLTACSPGFEKVDGKWAYVSYDEAVGKRVRYIEADDATFTILRNKQYAKDKDHVFLKTNIIAHADPATFYLIGKGYAADNTNVYLDSYTMIGADPKTFKRLSFPYSRDAGKVFCGTLPLDIDDIESFKVTKSSSAKSMVPTDLFIETNPEYAGIDTAKYPLVLYGFGKAKTRSEEFDGFKKIR